MVCARNAFLFVAGVSFGASSWTATPAFKDLKHTFAICIDCVVSSVLDWHVSICKLQVYASSVSAPADL